MAVKAEDSLQGEKQSSSPHFLMKCQTSEEWKTIVSTLHNLTEDASFDVDSSGITFRAMYQINKNSQGVLVSELLKEDLFNDRATITMFN